jgi:hypothetical protein
MESWGYDAVWGAYYWEYVLGCGMERGYVMSNADYIYFPADECWALFHDESRSDILCSMIDGCEY